MSVFLGSRFRPWSIFRRHYYDYKPREQKRLAESLESLANRDMILFRYEDPAKVGRYSIGAMALFPVWTYLGYTSYSLNKRLKPAESKLKDDWIYRNVMNGSRGVGVAFFLFGKSAFSDGSHFDGNLFSQTVVVPIEEKLFGSRANFIYIFFKDI